MTRFARTAPGDWLPVSRSSWRSWVRRIPMRWPGRQLRRWRVRSRCRVPCPTRRGRLGASTGPRGLPTCRQAADASASSFGIVSRTESRVPTW